MNVCLSKCLFCTETTAAQYIYGTECFSERDAFDTLFDHAPDKLNVVKKVGRFLFLKYLMCSCACLHVLDGVDVVCVDIMYNWLALHTLNTIKLYA